MLLKNYKYYNAVNYWFLILLGLIFLMVLIGGLTRLTNSGLSITEWELFTGIIPPTSSENGMSILLCINKYLNLNFIQICLYMNLK